MKSTLFFFFLLFSITIHSQIELKTDIGKLLGSEMYMSGEYLLSPWWGMDLSLGFENEKNIVREEIFSFQQTFELR